MLKELAEDFDPEPSPPRRGGAGETVRGLRASSMSGGGPAPLHPAPGPAHCHRGGAAAAGVAAGLLQTATSMGMASSRQAGPSGGLGRQRQAHPAPLAPGRTEGALPQAQEAPPGHRHRGGSDVSHHTRRPVGDGLPVRHHRRGHPQAAQHRRRVHPGVPRHRGGSIHRRRQGRGHPRAPRPGAVLRPSSASTTGPSSSPPPWPTGVASTMSPPCSIDPGSPWQNAWIESFNGRLRDERAQRLAVRQPPRSPGAHRGLENRLQRASTPQRPWHSPPASSPRPGPPDTNQHPHSAWTTHWGPLKVTISTSAGPTTGRTTEEACAQIAARLGVILDMGCKL